MISIVAAIDSKRGLGKNNDLLFRISQDFARMKKLTKGHPIIMGRRTFESIGKVLPNRTNIVVSRRPMDNALMHDTTGLVFATSLEEAIEIAKKSPGSDEIIIFGGGQIFKEAMKKNLVDVLHLTLVEGDYGADTFFPDYSKFKLVNEEKHEDQNYKYRFLTLQK